MKIRIAIVNSATFGTYTNVLDRLQRLGEVARVKVPREINGAQLAETLRGYHILVVSTNPVYDSEFFQTNTDVVLVARNGIGLDNIDVKAATENGVVVTRVPGEVEREAVAELAIALMLDTLRHVSASFYSVKQGRWQERTRFIGYELKGKTVGVIGLGNIGKRVAEIVTKGFNAKVVAYDPYLTKESVGELDVVLTDFESLLRESDIITLHAPQTPETRHIINSETIKMMKTGAILINTARGGLVDTNALVEALKEGKIRYAGLDVVEGDYVDAGHPLLQSENVILTPHIGAYTHESFAGIDQSVAESIEMYIRQQKPSSIVNPEVFQKKLRRLTGYV